MTWKDAMQGGKSMTNAPDPEVVRTIWKFGLPGISGFSAHVGYIELALPRDAHVLCVLLQDGQPQLYAEVDGVSKSELIPRRFWLAGTGRDLPDDLGRYIGSYQVGWFVGHLYEASGLGEPEPKEGGQVHD